MADLGLSEDQMCSLVRAQSYLVKHVPSQDDMFWSKVQQYEVLSGQTIRDIRGTIGSNPSDHTRMLLDRVRRGSKAMLHGLLKAFWDTNNDHLAEVIEGHHQVAAATGRPIDTNPLQEGLQEHKENVAKSIMIIPHFDFAIRGTTDLSKLYVPLYIVHNKEDRDNLDPAEVRSERIIPTQKIFKFYDGSKEPNTVLLEGAPGMGKTTFVKAYMYDWCQTEHCNSWYLIVYLAVTNISTSVECAVKSAISVRKDLVDTLFSLLWTYPANCLVIFDGIDECRDKTIWGEIKRFIEDSKMGKNPRVIVTARTYLCGMSSNLFHRHLKCDGFTEEQASLYIERYFDADKETADQIKAKVSFVNQSLTNPLRLYMMCFGVQRGLIEISNTDRLTSTMLFLSREQLLLQREVKKGDKQAFSAKERQEWRNFTLLSLKAMLQGQRSLTPEMLEQAGIPDDSVVHLYLNKEYTLTLTGEEERWTFLHETLYEFLSARGLELLEADAQLCVLLYICSNREFRNLMVLFVGLLGHNHGALSADVKRAKESLIEDMLKVCLVLQGLLDIQGIPPDQRKEVKLLKEHISELTKRDSVNFLIKTLCSASSGSLSEEQKELKREVCNEWRTVINCFETCIMKNPSEVFFGLMEEERYCGIIGHIVSCIQECQNSQLNIIHWTIPGHWSGCDGLQCPLEKDVFSVGDSRWVMVSYGIWQYGQGRVFDAWCPEDAVFAWKQHELNETEKRQMKSPQQEQQSREAARFQSLEFRLPSPRESFHVWGNKGQAPKESFAKGPWLIFFDTVVAPTREFHLYLAAETPLQPLLEALLERLDALKSAVSHEMEIWGGYIGQQELRVWVSKYKRHQPFSKLELRGFDVVSDEAVERVLTEFGSEAVIDRDTLYCKRTTNTV